MTDRDRLIEKFDYLQKVFMEDDDYDYFNEFLVDRLLADKDIIVPPCKVGETVYLIGVFTGQVIETKVVGIHHNKSGIYLCLENFTTASIDQQLGKTVFLTKEDAEAKLKELKDNG